MNLDSNHRALLGLALAVVLAPAARAGAECTHPADGHAIARALRQSMRCREHRLRLAPGATCAVPATPACGADLVRDAVALAYGGITAPAAGVHRHVRHAQLACQVAIGRGVTRFVGTKLGNVLHGAPRRAARARARRHLASLGRCRGVRVGRAPSDILLPAVGHQCEAAVGAPGRRVRVGRLRHCLTALLDVWTDRVTGGPAQRPNLVIILTDDQRWDTLPYMPAVQRELTSGGIEFTNAFVPTPLCCPSRASILTGRYAHATGVLTNTPPLGGARAFDDGSTLATWLHDAGYRTGLFGKYLNGYAGLPPYIPPGWDEWSAFHGAIGFFPPEAGYFSYFLTANPFPTLYPDQAADYSTAVLAAKAVDFIHRSARIPFLLYFAPYAPHSPATPAPRHEGVFAGLPPWRPASYDEIDVSDKPTWVQDLLLLPVIATQMDAFRLHQLESLLAVDDAVASIMQTLRSEGLDRRTLVLFSSDNGFSWGEHRWRGKDCPYEECVRVPLAVRYPPLAPLPRREAGFALNIDFAPTFAELAGIPLPPGVDGQSLVRLLDGTAKSWREDFLIEHWDGGVPDLAAVRDGESKYVEYRTGERERYDLVQDPAELQSLADDPRSAAGVAEHAARLRALYPAWGTSAAPTADRRD